MIEARHWRRALGAALVAVSSASYAAAQAPPPPPGGDERPTLLVGPLEIRPRLVIHSIGFDNNVFNETENPKRDFTIGAQPDVEFTVKPGPLKVVWLVGTDFVWYKDYASERTVNRSSNLNVDLKLSVLRPFFTYTVADTSGRPSAEIDARARRHPRTFAAGVTAKVASRTNLGFKWSDGRERYEEEESFRGQPLFETLNSDSRTFEGSFGIDLSPLTAFSIVVGHDDLTFVHEPLRNSTSLRIYPTLTFNPAGVINGQASIGYKTFKGDDPSLPDYEGLGMNGSVSVLIGDRYRVESRFSRDVQYSYEDALPYYIQTGVRATLATQMTSLLDVRVTGGYEHMNYKAYDDGQSPGTDRQHVLGGGVGFRIGDRKRVVIQAEFVERNSDRDHLREYTNHRIFGTLTWGA